MHNKHAHTGVSSKNNRGQSSGNPDSNRGAAVLAGAVPHDAHPRPPTSQQSRQGSTIGHDDESKNCAEGVPR